MRTFKEKSLDERFCKNEPNLRRRTRIFQRAEAASTISAISTFFAVSIFFNAAVSAQQSTAAVKTTGERTRAGAQSILYSTQPNGRIGGTRFRGATAPTPGENSRFESGALYGSAGNVVGVDRNSPNSAFQSSESRFKTKKDFDLIALRNELYRLRAAAQSKESGDFNGYNGLNPNGPRVVAANAPRPFPKAGGRTAQYGKTPSELAAEDARRAAELAQAAAAQNAAVRANANVETNAAPVDRATETIWMRGRAPIGSGTATPDFSRYDGYRDFNNLGAGGVLNDFNDYSVDSRWVELDGNFGNFDASGTVRSEFRGAPGLSVAPTATPLPGFAPTPEQTQAAFREYLEALLLRSPDVNALSPIRVDFVDGVATVRGIVPTPNAREIAGRILLTDPRVQRVDNRLTFVRNDVDASGLGAVVPINPASAPVNSNGAANGTPASELATPPTTLPDLAPLN